MQYWVSLPGQTQSGEEVIGEIMDKNITPLIQNFKQTANSSPINRKVIGLLAVALLLGVATAYLLTNTGAIKGQSTNSATGESVSKGEVVGSDDLKTFKDVAEGVLQEGGIGDEGQYHLVRPGGDSQNVYLTSSIVDLSVYLKKKVKVHGQTQAAQKAGWLMDVGRVEVLE